MNDPTGRLIEVINRLRDELNVVSYRALMIRADLAKQQYEITKANRAEDQSRNGTRTIAATLQVPKRVQAEERKARSDQRKFLRRNLVATWAGVVVVGAYTTFAALQWCSMQRMNSLYRQQLESTTAARVRINDPMDLTRLPKQIEVSVAFKNNGIANASDLRFRMDIRFAAIAEGRFDGPHTICEKPVINVLGHDDAPIAAHCFVDGVTVEDLNTIDRMERTVAVDGEFTYWNGFKRSAAEPICYRFEPKGQPGMGEGGMVDCATFRAHQAALVEVLKDSKPTR